MFKKQHPLGRYRRHLSTDALLIVRAPSLFVLLCVLFVLPVQAQSAYPGGSTGIVRKDVRVQYYDIQGRSADDLLQAMLRQGPDWQGQRYFGLTNTEVRYSYERVPTTTGCDLSRIEVQLGITVTLPRWRPMPGTPYALERAWHQFERNLRGHEAGHQQLAEEEGEMIRRILAAVRTPSCETMDAEARRRVDEVRATYNDLHHGYDTRTEHGRSQGALWPMEN